MFEWTITEQILSTEEKPVATHFISQGHSVEDMTVMVIEKLWKDDPVLRKVRENKWMRTLDTSHPRGMNLRVDTFWSNHVDLWPVPVNLQPHLWTPSPTSGLCPVCLCIYAPMSHAVIIHTWKRLYSRNVVYYNKAVLTTPQQCNVVQPTFNQIRLPVSHTDYWSWLQLASRCHMSLPSIYQLVEGQTVSINCFSLIICLYNWLRLLI